MLNSLDKPFWAIYVRERLWSEKKNRFHGRLSRSKLVEAEINNEQNHPRSKAIISNILAPRWTKCISPTSRVGFDYFSKVSAVRFNPSGKHFVKGVVFNDPRFPYLSASLLKNRTVALSRWSTKRGRGTKGFSTRTENSWLHRFCKTVIIECFSNGFSKEKKWDRDVLLEFRRLEFG